MIYNNYITFIIIIICVVIITSLLSFIVYFECSFIRRLNNTRIIMFNNHVDIERDTLESTTLNDSETLNNYDSLNDFEKFYDSESIES